MKSQTNLNKQILLRAYKTNIKYYYGCKLKKCILNY